MNVQGLYILIAVKSKEVWKKALTKRELYDFYSVCSYPDGWRVYRLRPVFETVSECKTLRQFFEKKRSK